MQVAELDRDMRDVIPTGTSRDSEYLFGEMTRRTLDLAAGGHSGPIPPREAPWRVLDVASGFGQDAAALAERGAFTVAAEPSGRMSALARQLADERETERHAVQLRAWSDRLPFRTGSFDAVLCKGSLDHFDCPERAIAEMARVTREDGRVVLAIANFDSLACRLARAEDAVRESWLGQELPPGRRGYDVPHDHFTRYDVDLMREQASPHLALTEVQGISIGWGLQRWARWLAAWPEPVAQWVLETLDAGARRLPRWADVVLLAGRPRRAATTSA